jgi:hypothetical protein
MKTNVGNISAVLYKERPEHSNEFSCKQETNTHTDVIKFYGLHLLGFIRVYPWITGVTVL